MNSRWIKTGAACLAALVMAGCWVKEEVGKQMQADIVGMQAEMEVVKKAHSEGKDKLQKRIQEADARIAELNKVIDEYRRATGRNAADVGVDIERIKTQLMEMRGQMEVNEHRLGIIEHRLSIIHKDLEGKRVEAVQRQEDAETAYQQKEKANSATGRLDAIQRPAKREDFYKLAYGLLDAKQFAAARILFKEFLQKWPSNAYSDNALYWIGESYYAEKNYSHAARTFQKVQKQYPKGDKAPDSLLKLGYCFYALEQYKNALPFFQEFVQSYPKNRMASEARKKIRSARKKLKKKKSR